MLYYQILLTGNNGKKNTKPGHTDWEKMFRIMHYKIILTGNKVQNNAIPDDWESCSE